jgi:hypothetical protein
MVPPRRAIGHRTGRPNARAGSLDSAFRERLTPLRVAWTVIPAKWPAMTGTTDVREPMRPRRAQAAPPARRRRAISTARGRPPGRPVPRRNSAASAACVRVSRGWAALASAMLFDSAARRRPVAAPAGGSAAPASSPRSTPTGAVTVRPIRAPTVPPVGPGPATRRRPAVIVGASALDVARRPSHRLRAYRPWVRCPVRRPQPSQRRTRAPAARDRPSVAAAIPTTACGVDRHTTAGATGRIAVAPSRATPATVRSASRPRNCQLSVRRRPPTGPPEPYARSGQTAFRAVGRPVPAHREAVRPATGHRVAARPVRVCRAVGRPAHVHRVAVRRAPVCRVAAHLDLARADPH